jgi:hypothetical protein
VDGGGRCSEAGEREVRISDVKGDTFQIMAGAPLGLREGAFLAIYAPTAKHFVEDKDKIPDARVSKVGITSSTATLSDKAFLFLPQLLNESHW